MPASINNLSRSSLFQSALLSVVLSALLLDFPGFLQGRLFSSNFQIRFLYISSVLAGFMERHITLLLVHWVRLHHRFLASGIYNRSFVFFLLSSAIDIGTGDQFLLLEPIPFNIETGQTLPNLGKFRTTIELDNIIFESTFSWLLSKRIYSYLT